MIRYSEISEALLGWYGRFARSMPWRGIQDPYRTWVSETMLQQTRVDTVIPYYHRFLSVFPTLPDLAAAEEADVLKLWEGLGYYSRARNLLKGARQVMTEYGGKIPEDPALLRKISGIGPYTAGAIASIAYQIRVPAVDGNVLRVYSRLFGFRENIQHPDVRKKLEQIADSMVPPHLPGDYNQAVMDLGAMVCVPGTPDCDRCPLSGFCDAFSRGDQADLPILPGKAPPKVLHRTVPVLLSGNRTLVRKRSESLLQGLWCFPLLDCSPSDIAPYLKKHFHLPYAEPGVPVHARHVFTHLIWEMEVVPVRTAPELPPSADYCWICADELDHLVFPAAMNVPLKTAVSLLSDPGSAPADRDL